MSYTNYNHDFRRNRITEPAQLVAAANLWTPTSDQKCMLGSIFDTNQGERYRYCKNGAVALAKNVVIQTSVPDAQAPDTLQTGYTLAVGNVTFNILQTTGNAWTDHALIDGYMIINQGTAATDCGDKYTIKDNKWITGDTVMQITIADEGGIRNAMAATSNITLVRNKYSGVVVKPTTATAMLLATTTTIVPASYYFWAQTLGVASVIADTGDTILIGDPLGHIDSSGTAGSVGLVSSYATDPLIGYCLYASAGADYCLIDLRLE